MRQQIELDELYAKALHLARTAEDATAPQPLPDTCPLTLDDLLSSRPDIPGLVARLA